MNFQKLTSYFHFYPDRSNIMYNSSFNNVGRKCLQSLFLKTASIERMFSIHHLCFHFRYFSKESTQEVLDEIYPKLFPLDTGKICGAFDLLSIFLNPLHGYELWLDDLMNLWNTYHNPSWNAVG